VHFQEAALYYTEHQLGLFSLSLADISLLLAQKLREALLDKLMKGLAK